MHSQLLPEILVKESSYAKLINDMNVKMDKEITSLTNNQQNEMEIKIAQLDVSTTSDVWS